MFDVNKNDTKVNVSNIVNVEAANVTDAAKLLKNCQEQARNQLIYVADVPSNLLGGLKIGVFDILQENCIVIYAKFVVNNQEVTLKSDPIDVIVLRSCDNPVELYNTTLKEMIIKWLSEYFIVGGHINVGKLG